MWGGIVRTLQIIQPPYLATRVTTPQLFGPTNFSEIITRAQIVENCCSVRASDFQHYLCESHFHFTHALTAFLLKKCDDLNNFSFPTTAFMPLATCSLEDMSRNAQRSGYVNGFIIAVGGK